MSNTNEVYEIQDLNDARLHIIMDIWHRAVQHTYNFIKGPDIITMRPTVLKNLREMDHIYGVNDDRGNLVAFMCIKGDHIMQLFVEPFHMRNGMGSALVEHAVNQLGVKLVVVNEENNNAMQFFRARGWAMRNRNLFDEFHLPYPVVVLYHE